MFPIVAIGTVIGAVASVIKGANWVGDHLVGPKDADASQPDTGGSGFQAALAAQNAGQPVPASAPPAASQAVGGGFAMVPATHDTDYQSLERMRAGLAAYQAADLQRTRHTDVFGQ